MDPITIALLVGSILTGLGGTIGTIVSNRRASERQQQHDRDMALLGQQLEQENFDYQVNTNQRDIDRKHMIEAGMNPALMYGGMSPVTADISSGGASAGRVMNPTDFSQQLRSATMPVTDVIRNSLDRRNTAVNESVGNSVANLNYQKQLESMARTLQTQQQNRITKRLENTIVDQAEQLLLNSRIAGHDLRSQIAARDGLTASNIALNEAKIKESGANVELLNSKILEVASNIEVNDMVRAQIAHDIKRIDAATENTQLDSAKIQESIKGSQLGRIMKEFGLNAQSLPPNLRNNKAYKNIWNTQMTAATTALIKAGFSEFEAVNSVLFYCAQDPSDVTPSLVNAASRIFSSSITRITHRIP